MVRRGLVPDLDEAARLIADGRVLVGGAPANTTKRLTDDGEPVQVTRPPAFVGRGGNKLDDALDRLGADVSGRRVLDVGSSTGGFTDCLLQRGAAEVVAVDVGTHQLRERLRADPRVTVMEQTDVRALSAERIGGAVPLITVDVSFISVRAIIESLAALLAPGGDLIVLVKPQFEVSRAEASRGRGVIRDQHLWRESLGSVARAAEAQGLVPTGATVSAVRGSKGNTEFFVRFNPVANGERGAGRLPAAWRDDLTGAIESRADD
ncbi:MAG: TlyA family RNA methyltransferase [Microthrixaceae bacterium]|nr:TlyA family RNA methyltransferase [Microthrixaceae bacterium]